MAECIRHLLEEGLATGLKLDLSVPICPSNGLQNSVFAVHQILIVCLVNRKHNHLCTNMVICTAHVSMHTVQCLGGPTGARRPLPPVVLVTHDPMYEEIPDSPPHNQVNCLREECTGQQKVMVEGHSGEVGKSPHMMEIPRCTTPWSLTHMQPMRNSLKRHLTTCNQCLQRNWMQWTRN